MKAIILSFIFIFITSCATTEKSESTGQFFDSTAITAKVKTALVQSDGLKSFNIKVTTYKNQVQLSGFVSSQEQKEQAEKIALEIPGVESVRNSIIVK